MAGHFIVLEGGDGVGKTTQAALLSSWMDAVGVSHIVARVSPGLYRVIRPKSSLIGAPEL